jgi:hypothetical protein
MIFLFDSADLTHVVYTVLYTNAYLDLITVNTDRPECNREVLVFPLQDIEGVKVGSHYFGYYIMFPMDIRYVLDNETIEHYKARVFPPIGFSSPYQHGRIPPSTTGTRLQARLPTL